MGITTDKEIMEHIVYNFEKPESKHLIKMLKPSLIEASNIRTSEMAINYMAKYVNVLGYSKIFSEDYRKINYIKSILNNDLLPHLNNTGLSTKIYFLGFMIRKLLLTSIGQLPYDDRDSYINKRVDTPGILIGNLFRQYYTKLLKDMKNAINK